MDVIYNSFLSDQWKGNIDLDTDTFHLLLVTSSYVPDRDNHTRRSDITNEVVGTGYTTGGIALTGLAVTQDNVNNRAVWDGNDAVWASVSVTAAGGVICKWRGGLASADELVKYIDFGRDITKVAEPFTVAFNDAGILYSTQG